VLRDGLARSAQPLGDDEGLGARPIDKEEKPVVYVPTPFEPRDPRTFPRRQFLYGRHYARKFVSMTVAPGDVGKTSLTLTEAVAMAANMPLLGVHFRQAYRVWYWNGEDPRDEIDRRVLAICEHHKIDQQSLVANLFLDSGRNTRIVVAEMTRRSGFKIVVPVKEALIAALIELKIDILIIDPFVKAHRVNENDNMLMDTVATIFADIADAANCCVELVQHTRKTNGEEVTLEDARGAGSTTATARMVRTLNRMPKHSALSLASRKNRPATTSASTTPNPTSPRRRRRHGFISPMSAWAISVQTRPSTTKTTCR
jgi:hypothetical protein